MLSPLLKTRISHSWKGRVPVFSSSSCFSWDLVQLLQIKFSLFYNATDDKLLETYLCFNLITQILVPVLSRIYLETLGGLDAGCLAGCSRLPSGQSATTLVYAGSELGSATEVFGRQLEEFWWLHLQFKLRIELKYKKIDQNT